MTPVFQSTPTEVPDRFDAGFLEKRIALVARETDHTAGRGFARFCDPDQVGISPRRVAFENPATLVGALSLAVRTSLATLLLYLQRGSATQGRH